MKSTACAIVLALHASAEYVKLGLPTANVVAADRMWADISVSPDGFHASARWAGAVNGSAGASCPYGCDACEKFCQNWKPKAISCCNGLQCCCCATSAPDGGGCLPEQCISMNQDKCPSDMCSAPTPPAPPPAPATPVPPDGPKPDANTFWQLTCTDAQCKSCTKNVLPQGQCLQLGSTQSATAKCGATTLTLSVYSTADCTGTSSPQAQPINQCLTAAGGGGYLEDVCP